MLFGSLRGVAGVPSPLVAIGANTVSVTLRGRLNFAAHARSCNVKWPRALVSAAIVATMGHYVAYRSALVP